MKKKKSSGLVSLLAELFSAYINRITHLIHLAGLEAQLAVKTFLQMIAIFYLMTILLIATWLSGLFVLFTYLVSINYSPVFASVVLVAVNIILLLIGMIIILKIKKNLFFHATRKQLQDKHNQGLIE